MSTATLQYRVHKADSSPEVSLPILENSRENMGFTPNLFGVLAESPAALKAYKQLNDIFSNSSLSATEQQVVLLTVSHFHACHYCMAAHSTIAQMSKVDQEIIDALRSGNDLPDAKLNALGKFARNVVETRGYPDENAARAFHDAGYTRAHALEVITGIAMKTISNYSNHLADTPVDEAFAKNEWKP